MCGLPDSTEISDRRCKGFELTDQNSDDEAAWLACMTWPAGATLTNLTGPGPWQEFLVGYGISE